MPAPLVAIKRPGSGLQLYRQRAQATAWALMWRVVRALPRATFAPHRRGQAALSTCVCASQPATAPPRADVRVLVRAVLQGERQPVMFAIEWFASGYCALDASPLWIDETQPIPYGPV